jgi:hypothetical protein
MPFAFEGISRETTIINSLKVLNLSLKPEVIKVRTLDTVDLKLSKEKNFKFSPAEKS